MFSFYRIFIIWNVLGSYCRLARVRFAWLPRRLVPIHLGDPLSTRSFDESIAASIRYTRPVRYRQLTWEYPLLYLEAYFWNLDVIYRSPERFLYPTYTVICKAEFYNDNFSIIVFLQKYLFGYFWKIPSRILFYIYIYIYIYKISYL